MRRTPRGAFTLIEVLAASVLAAVVLIALVGLLRAVAAQRSLAAEFSNAYPTTRLLDEQLRRDLRHAQFYQVQPRRLRLRGFVGSDRVSGSPNLRLADVVYFVRQVSGEDWLFRQVIPLDDRADRRQPEPIWQGVSQFLVVELVERDEADDGPLPPAGMLSMPAALRIGLLDPRGATLLEADIMHHSEY